MLRSRMLLSTFVTILLFTCAAAAQRGHRNPPTVFQDENRLPAATYAQPDPKLMLQQANDLKQLSDGIPDDVQKIAKGLISKDLSERLKKIEKLAKKLREEIDQQTPSRRPPPGP